MTEEFKRSVCEVFWRNTQVTRREIFGDGDQMPPGDPATGATMWPGFVGRRYAPGRMLLVAHYPAGGTAPFQGGARDVGSRDLYGASRRLRDSTDTDRDAAFDNLMDVGEGDIPRWSMMRVIRTVLDATDLELADIALINAVPYRIAGNKSPGRQICDRAWMHCTSGTVRALQPGYIAALGVAAGSAISGRPETRNLYVLPRRIGDNSVHPEAIEVARELAAWMTSGATREMLEPRRPAAATKAEP